MSNDDDDDDDDGDDCGDDDADYDDNEYFSLNIEPTLKSVTVKKTVINKNRLSFAFCCCLTVCFVIFSRRL